jgi:hypothetical protein
MPVQLRQLFVDICLYCNLTNALQFFELNLPHLMEDYVRSGHEEEVAKNLTLKWIQDKLLLNNHLMENFSLPVPDFYLINQLIQAKIAADNEVDTHESLRWRQLATTIFPRRPRWNRQDVPLQHPHHRPPRSREISRCSSFYRYRFHSADQWLNVPLEVQVIPSNNRNHKI